MSKIIAFDMDGTIADLYGVPDWCNKINSFDPSPYIEAKPLWNMDDLRDTLLDMVAAGWEIRVISWLAKCGTPAYNAKVRAAKRAWLERYNFPAEKVHLLAYGTTKADAIRHMKAPAVLVDDNARVRSGWHLGDVIDPRDTSNLPRLLRKLYLTPEG